MVLPSYRNQGIQRNLIKMRIETAKNLGGKEIHSQCHPDNIASRRALENCGFKNYKTWVRPDGYLCAEFILDLQINQRLYILAPNGNDFSEQQMKLLRNEYDEVLYIDKIMPFSQLPKINDNSVKVFAIDPDFCDWNIPNSALDIQGLAAICLDTTSFSWIDLEYAKNKNITITNVRHWSTESVAEQAIMIALNLARKIPLQLQNNMKIDFATMRGVQLSGLTAGIIGLGHIGKQIANLCAALGMNVVYWSEKSTDSRFEKLELNELLKNADVIFPTLLKNKDTEKLITDDMLLNMKRNAMLIEITGNFLYNHELLLQMISDQKLYGYGFEESNPKKYDGNIFAVPPLAYYTDQAMNKNIKQWLDCIIGAKSGDYKNKLN
jgi:lactate dehydrogenase-like 2-hydroxyacid dehydrogenase